MSAKDNTGMLRFSQHDKMAPFSAGSSLYLNPVKGGFVSRAGDGLCPAAFVGMEALDLVGKFFPGGALVLGALMKPWAPKAA